MSFPSLLAAESRLAFHLCRPRHAAARRSLLSTTSCLARRSRPGSVPKEELQPHTQDVNKSGTTVEPLQLTGHAPTTTDLTATEKTKQALDNRRKVDVPMKVLPKAQLTLEHKLSPEQRLHIEHLTRHPPPQRPPKVYKERLLIYHAGYAWVNAMTLGRVLALSGTLFVTFVVVPAYYKYGTPVWYLSGIWLASFVPLLFLHRATMSLATEVWLRLPPSARSSAHAAMKYARNLPRDALLEMRFMRWTGLVGSVLVKLVDTTAARTRVLKPVNFRWTGVAAHQGTFLRPNPTEFFVKPNSAGGRAARDTIPGIWQVVYKRLTGKHPGSVSKWKG